MFNKKELKVFKYMRDSGLYAFNFKLKRKFSISQLEFDKLIKRAKEETLLKFLNDFKGQ